MSLQIYINGTGELLDLGTFSVEVVFSNPFFQTEFIPKILSYPFQIPATAKNRRELLHMQLLDSGALPEFIEVQVLLFGQHWYDAEMRVKEAFDQFEIVLEEKPGGIPANFGKQELRDLMSATRFMGTQLKVIDLLYDDSTFGGTSSSITLAVGTSLYLSAGFATLSTAIDDIIIQCNAETDIHHAIASRIGLDTIRLTSAGVGARNWYDHSQTRDGSGVNGLGFTEVVVTEDWITPHISEITTYMDNTVAGSWPAQEMVFFPIKNPRFYSEGGNPDFEGIVNYYDADAGAFENDFIDLSTKVAAKRNISPQLYNHEVLYQLFIQYGFSLSGDFFEGAEYRTATVYNNRALDAYDYVYGTLGNIVEPINLWDAEIRYAEHVPEIEVSTYLSSLRKLFNIGVFIISRDQRVQLTTASSVLKKAPTKDLTPLVSARFPLQYEIWEGVTFSSVQDPEDQLANERTEELTDTVIAEGELEVTSEFATLLMEDKALFELTTLPRYWKLPATKQPGSSAFFEQGEQEFTPRLLFYRGMHPIDSGGGTYPLGAHDTTDVNGTSTGELSLDWNGEGGLYEVHWQAWIEMLSRARGAQIPVTLTPDLLTNIHDFFLEKWTLQNAHVLIAEVRVTITDKGIEQGDVTVVKV